MRHRRLSVSTHEYIGSLHHYSLDIDDKKHLKFEALKGAEIVDNRARLCAMNLYLHGIGGDNSPVKVGDSLRTKPSEAYEMVLTNPPFGKKSSVTVINEEGEQSEESLAISRN